MTRLAYVAAKPSLDPQEDPCHKPGTIHHLNFVPNNRLTIRQMYLRLCPTVVRIARKTAFGPSLRHRLRPWLKASTAGRIPELFIERCESDGGSNGLLEQYGRRELDRVVAPESVLPRERLGARH